MAGLGHEVKPQPDRKVWLPAAERRRRKRQEEPQRQPQAQQQTQQDAVVQIDLVDVPEVVASRLGIAVQAADLGNTIHTKLTWSDQRQLSLDDFLPSHARRCGACLVLLRFLSSSLHVGHLAFVYKCTEFVSQPKMYSPLCCDVDGLFAV